jgi:hypothetical protein
VPKKTGVAQSENVGSSQAGGLSAEAKIDKVKTQPRSKRVKNGKLAPRKKSPAPKTATLKRRTTKKGAEPPEEEIRLRAYFISERRRRFDLAGDASSDWLEAKRQLLSESGPR